MKSIDDYWTLKEEEFNSKYVIKIQHLDKMIEDAREKSSTATIFKQQEDLITDLTITAIQRCEKLCDDVETKVRNKGIEYVTTLTSQLDENEKKRSNETFEFWQHMKKEIGKNSSIRKLSQTVIAYRQNCQRLKQMSRIWS